VQIVHALSEDILILNLPIKSKHSDEGRVRQKIFCKELYE
jgi:hypothetical protein